MSQIYHFVELVGTSSKDFSDAINAGLAAVKKEGKEVRWFEVKEQRGYVADNVTYYQATLKIGIHA